MYVNFCQLAVKLCFFSRQNHSSKGKMSDDKDVVLCPLHQGGCTFKVNHLLYPHEILTLNFVH